MKFCPTCDVRLKKDSNTLVLSCPKCNYTEGGPKDKKKTDVQEVESDFLVVGENEGNEFSSNTRKSDSASCTVDCFPSTGPPSV